MAGPVARGRRVHRLRGRARCRDGPQARPGVPPRRAREGALAALRRRAERDRLGPGRWLGFVERAGGVGRSARTQLGWLDEYNFRASAVQVNPRKNKEKSLDFLAFLWPIRGFSKGYRESK